eukprot:2581058-Rhodomonas_salina.4
MSVAGVCIGSTTAKSTAPKTTLSCDDACCCLISWRETAALNVFLDPIALRVCCLVFDFAVPRQQLAPGRLESGLSRRSSKGKSHSSSTAWYLLARGSEGGRESVRA